jgi:hypothetical protein
MTSRVKLKEYFGKGKVPTEGQFAELIDSLVHKDDLPPTPTPQPTPQPFPVPPRPPQGMRLGSFNPDYGDRLQLLDRSDLLDSCRRPADGHWYPLIKNLNDCHGFELVACANGLIHSRHHAITHAIALTSFASHATVRQSFSEEYPPIGWRLWRLPQRLLCQLLSHRCLRRVQFRWVRGDHGVTLQVRSNTSFGLDHEGQQVAIACHITRLW